MTTTIPSVTRADACAAPVAATGVTLPDDATRLDAPGGPSSSGPLASDAPAGHARRAGAGLDGIVVADVDRAEKLAAMRAGELGSVHSWELVTAVDGPGTRLTVFLNGCPLRCLYCHNPDTFAMKDGKPVTADELLARVKRYLPAFRATHGGLTLSGGEVSSAVCTPFAFAPRSTRDANAGCMSTSPPESVRPPCVARNTGR